MRASLSRYEGSGAYVLEAGDGEAEAAARAAGLTLSRTGRGPGNERVYFTRDPYAALPFWPVADAGARDHLLLLRLEYEASWHDGQGLSGPDLPVGEGARRLGHCPMPFQAAGVRYCLERRHALIGDEPGLGKTVQAVLLANAERMRRVLVLCPAVVRLQWAGMVRTWTTVPRPDVYAVQRSADGVSPFAHWTVVSYDLARVPEVHRALAASSYDMLVLDEAHYLKSVEAIRTRAVFGGGAGDFAREHLSLRADRVLAMTGTPLPNRPRECYTLARSLCWDAVDWLSYEGFKHRYNPSGRVEERVEEREGRLPELRARLRCNLMVRRLKRQVLDQLPEVEYELTYVEEDAAVRRALRAEGLLGIDPADLEGIDAELMGQVSTVRREMGEAKAPRAAEHVANVLEGGLDKVVVFAWHRSVMDVLEERLGRYGVARVDGSTTGHRREARKRAFVEDPEIRVFLANMEAGGQGLDGLQRATDRAVFAEASWVPKDNEQAVDRLHRIGQEGAVLAQFLVAPGSLDERVLGTAIRKRRVVHESLDDGGNDG